jgi:hypothetical protein
MTTAQTQPLKEIRMSIPTPFHTHRTCVTAAACLALLASAAGATGTGAGNDGDPKGLAARVQALEAQNARQKSRIRQLERRPNVAGKACPEGLSLVGFGSDGTLICEAPWASTTPGPNSHLRCNEHFDPFATAGVLGNFLNTNTMPFLQNYLPLSARGSADLEGGIDFTYALHGGLWTPWSPFIAGVQLVEVRIEEPCVDAVRVVIVVPELTAEGTAELDLGVLGDIRSPLQLEMRDVVLEFLVPLSNPDLEGAPVGTTADRIPLPSNANATLVSGEVVVTVDDTRLGDFPGIAEILSDAYAPQLRDEMVDQIVEQIRIQLGPTLRSPVTLQVVAAP